MLLQHSQSLTQLSSSPLPYTFRFYPRIEEFEVYIIENYDEQQKIADCLSSLDELIETTSRKVEILKEHKKGLMQQLFPKI